MRIILAAAVAVAAPGIAAQSTIARTVVTDAMLRQTPQRLADASGGFRVSDDTVDFGPVAGGCLLGGGRAVFLSTRPRVLLLMQPRSAPAFRFIGKGGTGPGEFDRPWAMSCFSDDSVAVLEIARVTLVDVSRGAATSLAIQPAGGDRWYEAMARLTDNTYVFAGREIGKSNALGSERETIELRLTQGLPRGVNDGVPIARLPGAELVRARVGEGMATSQHPFGRNLLLAFGRTTIYAMDTETSDLTSYSSEGRVTRKAHFDTRPRALTKAAVAAHQARRLSGSRNPLDRKAAEALRAQTPMPRTLPLFDRIAPVASGGVLLREFVVEGDSVARWIQLDLDLRPRAILRLPPDFRVLAADESSILGVQSNSDGTELVFLPSQRARD